MSAGNSPTTFKHLQPVQSINENKEIIDNKPIMERIRYQNNNNDSHSITNKLKPLKHVFIPNKGESNSVNTKAS